MGKKPVRFFREFQVVMPTWLSPQASAFILTAAEKDNELAPLQREFQVAIKILLRNKEPVLSKLLAGLKGSAHVWLLKKYQVVTKI
jgi:hypothetical protein